MSDPDDRVKKGFRIGIEAAAKRCDEMAQIEDPLYRSAYECAARHVRSLSASPAPRGDRLREAATEALDWFYPRPDEGQAGFYDRIAMQFWRATGIWPPGKSAPMEMHTGDPEAAHKAWREWNEKTRDAIGERLRAALSSGTPGSNEEE